MTKLWLETNVPAFIASQDWSLENYNLNIYINDGPLEGWPDRLKKFINAKGGHFEQFYTFIVGYLIKNK